MFVYFKLKTATSSYLMICLCWKCWLDKNGPIFVGCVFTFLHWHFVSLPVVTTFFIISLFFPMFFFIITSFFHHMIQFRSQWVSLLFCFGLVWSFLHSWVGESVVCFWKSLSSILELCNLCFHLFQIKIIFHFQVF